MCNPKHYFILLSIIIFSQCKGPDAENIQLPPLFGDNMVLQRDMEVAVWGTAEPGGTVQISINDKEASAKVGEDGKWEVNLPPHAVRRPF